MTFDWSDVAGAATYQLQVDDATVFSSPLVFTATPPASSSQATTSTLRVGRFYWRVRALDGGGTAGAWSTVRRFEVR